MDNNISRPRLLLQACCAPCSSHALEHLSKTYDIDLFFHNPNIEPIEEYTHRLSELRRLTAEMPLPGKVNVIEGDYDNEEWHEVLKALPPGFEEEKEGGERCKLCIRYRLKKTARYANAVNSAVGADADSQRYDCFSTTLTVSPHKNAEFINATVLELGGKYGVKALPLNLKKQNGYKRSIELSKIYSLYRQNYCGCLYSLKR